MLRGITRTSLRRTASTATAASSSSSSLLLSAATTAAAPQLSTALRSAGNAQREILNEIIGTKLQAAETKRLLERWNVHAQKYDNVTLLLLAASCTNIFIMSLIIFDWIYQGHLQLWDGVYGLEEEEEDDEEDDQENNYDEE